VATTEPPIDRETGMIRGSISSSGTRAAVAVFIAVGFFVPGVGRAAEAAALSDELLASMSQTVREVLVEAVPERIEKNLNWGDTRERFSQLKLKSDDGRLQFQTTTKPVKHGLWKQVAVVPVEPEKNLNFRIVEARSIGRSAVAFQVAAASPLKLTARVERWRTGVKMLNFSTDAQASIEMRIAGELTYDYKDVDGKNYLTFRPTITKVDLKLIEFDLHRIGQADGALVKELGDMLSDPLADQLDKHEPKVAKKLNDTITKRQDKLRIPLSLPSFDFGNWLGGTKTASAEPIEAPAAR